MKFFCDDELLCDFDEYVILAMEDLEEVEKCKERLKTKVKRQLEAQKQFYLSKFRRRFDPSNAMRDLSDGELVQQVVSKEDYQNYTARMADKQKQVRAEAEVILKKKMAERQAKKDALKKEHEAHAKGKKS